MQKIREETVFSAFLLLFFLWIIFDSISLRADVRLFPLLVSVPAALMMALLLLSTVSVRVSTLVERLGGRSFFGNSSGQEGKKPQGTAIRAELGAFLAVGLLCLIFWMLGTLLSIALFLPVFLRLVSRQSWPVTVGVTIGVIVFAQLVFGQILGMDLMSSHL